MQETARGTAAPCTSVGRSRPRPTQHSAGRCLPCRTYNPEDSKRGRNPVSQKQAMEELVSAVTSTTPDGFTPTIVKQTVRHPRRLRAARPPGRSALRSRAAATSFPGSARCRQGSELLARRRCAQAALVRIHPAAAMDHACGAAHLRHKRRRSFQRRTLGARLSAVLPVARGPRSG